MMPRRKYATNKKIIRRRRRKKYSPRRRLTLSGFPQSKTVRLKYVDTGLTLDAFSSLSTSHIYRANSCFDPDYTSSGHQPMGYDQWSAIYSKYVVLGARLKMIYTPALSTNVTPAMFGITFSTDASPLSNYSSLDNILESKLTSQSVRTAGSTTANGSNVTQSVTKYFSAKKFFGSVYIGDGSSHSAETGSDPSQQAYFGCWAASIDGNNPGSLSFRVEIEYIVQFKEPRNLNGSI